MIILKLFLLFLAYLSDRFIESKHRCWFSMTQNFREGDEIHSQLSNTSIDFSIMTCAMTNPPGEMLSFHCSLGKYVSTLANNLLGIPIQIVWFSIEEDATHQTWRVSNKIYGRFNFGSRKNKSKSNIGIITICNLLKQWRNWRYWSRHFYFERTTMKCNHTQLFFF